MFQKDESIRVQLEQAEHELPIKRGDRKTVALHVTRAGGFEVRAPHRMPMRMIAEFVHSHRDWLIEREQKLAQQPAKVLRYEDGAPHYFLGQSYPLKLLPATRGFVSIADGQFRIATPSLDGETIQKLLMRFYTREAEFRLPERVRFWHNKLYGTPLPALNFRAMKARWGSCAADGSITLNSCLLRASWPAVDYVVVHELCHLTHFDHGAGFKALLSAALPDWRERKRLLTVPCGY